MSKPEIAFLAKAAKNLSDAFTHNRNELSPDYFNNQNWRAAYLAHFFLTNAVKIIHSFSQCVDLGAFQNKEYLDILDVGMGPGTGVIASSIFFSKLSPDLKINITGLEQNKDAVTDAENLFELIKNKNHKFTPILAKLKSNSINSALQKNKFDIIIAANVLNEFGSLEKQFSLTQTFLDLLAPAGILIIIDPALRETTLELMKLRDLIAEKDQFNLLAPCLHFKPCPMLASQRKRGGNWCHFYIEWDRPKIIQQLDTAVGTNHAFLKMAYLILQKNSTPKLSHSPSLLVGEGWGEGSKIFSPPSNSLPQGEGGFQKQHHLWRVVSSPLVSKGKMELVLCGANGEFKKVMRLNKNASDTNQKFGETKRGDIIDCDEVSGGIGKMHAFEIIWKW